jgi:hypothetical protein
MSSSCVHTLPRTTSSRYQASSPSPGGSLSQETRFGMPGLTSTPFPLLPHTQAEVQQFYSDGSISIHTRSLKYGKVRFTCSSHAINVVLIRCVSRVLCVCVCVFAVGGGSVSGCPAGADEEAEEQLPHASLRRGRHPGHQRLHLALSSQGRALNGEFPPP